VLNWIRISNCLLVTDRQVAMEVDDRNSFTPNRAA
jgi:hypothetical protein